MRIRETVTFNVGFVTAESITESVLAYLASFMGNVHRHGPSFAFDGTGPDFVSSITK